MHLLRLGIGGLCLAFVMVMAGCGDTTDVDAGGVDAASGNDSGLADGGDVEPDAAVADAGDEDAGSSPVDAGPTDAGLADAGASDAGDCRMCFSRTYEFGRDGGFVRERRRSRIEPCAGFVHRRMSFGMGGGTTRCGNDVPVCDEAPGSVTVADVLAAFEHPDVVAAFAAAPVLYGRDTRPVDGQVFEIEEVGAATVTVASPCGSITPSCVEIPPGVAALQELLVRLETERLAVSDCDTVFPAP